MVILWFNSNYRNKSNTLDDDDDDDDAYDDDDL